MIEQPKKFPPHIQTDRFVLRELSIDDVTEKYLAWLSEADTQKWIVASSGTQRLSDLEQYVRSRIGRPDVLFLGIFEKHSGVHVGNIKYEPISPAVGSAVMGVLIGDSAFRGKGVFGEALKASSDWLKRERGINRILLGVDRQNHAAINAYRRAGFVDDQITQVKAQAGTMMMVLHV